MKHATANTAPNRSTIAASDPLPSKLRENFTVDVFSYIFSKGVDNGAETIPTLLSLRFGAAHRRLHRRYSAVGQQRRQLRRTRAPHAGGLLCASHGALAVGQR